MAGLAPLKTISPDPDPDRPGVGADLRAGTRPDAPARHGDGTGRRPPPHHVPGLDGLRAVAALYVVLFHCWLLAFPGFPRNAGPSWLGWLMYGRLAVVLFLVLSGFSLAVSPAGRGWRTDGLVRYLRRRAWRILPPYWAALVLSLLVAAYVVPASHFGPPSGRTVLVYGLVIQDIVAAHTPNGAFWSIGVEAELYLLFPLLLALRRWLGAAPLLAGVTLLVVARGLAAPGASPVEAANRLTPQLAPVFVAGLVCAGIVAARETVRRLPWHLFAASAAAPVGALILARGPVWTVHHYFWVDLAVAPALTMLVAAVATGRPVFLARLLAGRPLRALGGCSYSLYLVHLPVVMIVGRKIAPDLVGPGLPTFCFTLAVAVPVSVLGALLFSRVFELPFQRHRSWTSLASAARSRGTDLRERAKDLWERAGAPGAHRSRPADLGEAGGSTGGST